jgi:hypothetical protein
MIRKLPGATPISNISIYIAEENYKLSPPVAQEYPQKFVLSLSRSFKHSGGSQYEAASEKSTKVFILEDLSVQGQASLIILNSTIS